MCGSSNRSVTFRNILEHGYTRLWLLSGAREALESRCNAAWEAYEAEAKKAGLRVETPIPVPRSVSELIRVGFHLDPRIGPVFSQADSTAMFLRRDYLKVLWELSRHLSSHSC